MTGAVRVAHAALAIAALTLATTSAHAADDDRHAAPGGSERPPLAESLLTESATDLDAEEQGELELEANYATVRARRGPERATLTSLEVEWRALEQVGVRLEPSYTTHTSGVGDDAASRADFGVSGAIAVGVFHDFARDTHLQIELLGRTRESGNARVFEPGDAELPYAADLVGATRRGRFTFRATVGGEAGDAFAHAPLHTDLAVLTGVTGDERFGFVALEARADWARQAPLVLAPELVADMTPLGLPFRFGVALPWNAGAADTASSFGVFARLMLMTGREVEYGRSGQLR